MEDPFAEGIPKAARGKKGAEVEQTAPVARRLPESGGQLFRYKKKKKGRKTKEGRKKVRPSGPSERKRNDDSTSKTVLSREGQGGRKIGHMRSQI